MSLQETTVMNRATPRIVQTSSYEEIHQLQSDAIRARAERLGRRLSILEAGCGRRWRLDLTGVDFTLTGVDLDLEALDLRKTKMQDLDVAIARDICSIQLPEASFDVVYSAFVWSMCDERMLHWETLSGGYVRAA